MAFNFTVAMAMGIPRLPELVSPPSFPFNKSFFVLRAAWFSTLEFDVYTSYDSYVGPLADVRINGVSVGQIPPRGPAQTGGELAPVSFQFGNGMLKTLGPQGRTGFNQFEIVPGSPFDYLVVGNWRFFYYQGL